MNNLFKFYEVGGKVRDEILGLESKDVDYVAVPNDKLLQDFDTAESMFSMLEQYLRDEKFEIFLITADCFTIRAKFPKDHKYSGVADFVMARKEIGYIPGTRTPIVKPGTLYDDLERRDATLNALAKDEDGTIIDYFNGLTHLKYGILRTPLDPIKTFDDDPLRIIRFIRFSITKGFTIPGDIDIVIQKYDYDKKMGVVSTERIREELLKCFKHNTLLTLWQLNCFPNLRDYIFQKQFVVVKTNDGTIKIDMNKDTKKMLDIMTLASEMAFGGDFNNIFGGLVRQPKSVNPYEGLNDGFELRPIELSKKESENPRIVELKYSHLYKDGVKVSDEIFRKGGLCHGFKEGYCGLIHYTRTKQPKKNDSGFSVGDSVIINTEGKICLSRNGLDYPYHVGGNVGSIGNYYYNLLTGEKICYRPSSVIVGVECLYLDSRYDFGYYEVKIPVGVYKLNKITLELTKIDEIK